MRKKQNGKPNAKPTAKSWIKFAVVLLLYLAFLYWVESWLGLIVVPFIFDAYITKKIRWTWWKDLENPVSRTVMSWVDAIVFALVAVYFVNNFFFQNYKIPSSSLEKSLLVGDYLLVSKMSYGPRIPQTPLSMPLTQHTLPVFGCKSYIEWPKWDYRRVDGLGKVQLGDIVVFNYPTGDTVAVNYNYDFYDLCYSLGYAYKQQMGENVPNMASLDSEGQMKLYQELYGLGRQIVGMQKAQYGEIVSRPVDKRENYVKRCVGLPGQTLQIKDKVIYLDGKPMKQPEEVQFNYRIYLKGDLTDDICNELGISDEDRDKIMDMENGVPLTKKAYDGLMARKDLVDSIVEIKDGWYGNLYPLNHYTGWTRDNYGPIWIPAKGQSVKLTMDNIAIYERPIRVYEGNQLEVKNGKIYINGKEADSYKFKMDYFWMMGDNRHNSADSRYWGFVPEDHVVGKPIMIWLSISPDYNPSSRIRWDRIFRRVDNIK
ncbi:MAG: S26 family signal peptidase [Bacteroides sp. 43_108]|nr:MAG: S26 family signal peptidase [Bacteroides sp. 43_108]